MARCPDSERHRTAGTADPAGLIERQPFVGSLGHIGLMPAEPGDPTPEQRAVEDREVMETPHRHLLLHLRDRKRRGEDNGELEAFHRREQRRQDAEMQQLAEVLQAYESGKPLTRPVTHTIRRPRFRARRVGCARRRGSRRSTGTGSRAGPSDDPGESDPGDQYFPLVAGESAGEVQ